jgi:hypothetical protein
MNKRQINKTRSYSVIILVLENYSTLFSSYPELTQGQQRLKDYVAQIDQNRQVQETNNSGLTMNKTKLREALSKLIHQFSAALVAYAISTKNIELKTKATYNNSSLIRAADPIFYDIGMLLYNLALPLANELQRFFITQAEFDEMATTLSNFKASIPQKRVATGTSKVSTGNINETFKTIDALLKDEMDVLLMPFQFTQPDFYNEYLSAHSVVDTGGNRKKTDETPVA